MNFKAVKPPFLIFLISLFSLHAHAVVFGEKDNRNNVSTITDVDVLNATKSSAMMIDSRHIQFRQTDVLLKGKSLQKFKNESLKKLTDLCPDERFISEPVIGSCSGFLVSEDLLFSAGHCVTNQYECKTNGWVFDYTDEALKNAVVNDDEISIPFPKKNVSQCDHVVARWDNKSDGETTDYSLIRLSESVKNRPFAELTPERPTLHTPIFTIGYPTGLPVKVTNGARILHMKHNFFESDLDIFAGNSGSAVYNSETKKVIGVAVRGNKDVSTNEIDYTNDSGKCSRVRKVLDCGNDQCSWAASTLSTVMIADLKKALAQIEAQKNPSKINVSTLPTDPNALLNLARTKGIGRCFIEQWKNAKNCDHTLRIVKKNASQADQTQCFIDPKTTDEFTIEDPLEPKADHSNQETILQGLQKAIQSGACNL